MDEPTDETEITTEVVSPEWRPASELPEADRRPGRQFVFLEGVCEHSGGLWGREYIGDAYVGDGQQGYRQEDIDRLLKAGDMDFGEVKFWAPYRVVWPGEVVAARERRYGNTDSHD